MPKYISVIILLVYAGFASAAEIKIGVRAHSGVDKGMQQWQKTADYLSSVIPEHKFMMVPVVNIDGLIERVGDNDFDFVFFNPI